MLILRVKTLKAARGVFAAGSITRCVDGTFTLQPRSGNRDRCGSCGNSVRLGSKFMNSIIYLVGVVVIVLAILSFIGIR